MLQSFCRRNQIVAFSTLKRCLASSSDGFTNTSSRSKSDISEDISNETCDTSKTTTGNMSKLSAGLSKNSGNKSKDDTSNDSNDNMSKSPTDDTSKVEKSKNLSRPLPKTTDDLQRRMRDDFFRREADWERMVDFDKLTEDEKVIHKCHKEAIQGLLIFHSQKGKDFYQCNLDNIKF